MTGKTSFKMLLVSIVLAGNVTAQTSLTNGLVAYLSLNGGATDDSGNGHSGIMMGTLPAPDGFGNPKGALAFDGQKSEIQIPLNYDFSQSGFTFSAMFLFDRAYSERAHQHYLMDGRQADSGIVYANVDAGLIQALGTDVHPSSPLNPKQWYQLVATHDNASGTTEIYLNGILIHSATVDLGVNFLPSITLGTRFTGTEHLTGRLADVRIYDYALSPRAISELYAYESQFHGSQQIVEASDPFMSGGNLVNPANGLPVERPAAPTSSILELSNMTGELRLLDSKGLILETNLTYTPRIDVSSLSSNDLAALLENDVAYSSLTAFGRARYTNDESPVVESQLERTWLHGKSLQDKIQTRLEILDAMKRYNSDAASYSLCVAGENHAQGVASFAQGTMDAKTVSAINAAQEVEYEKEMQVYGVGSFRARYEADKDWEQAKTELPQAAKNEQNAENALVQVNQEESYYLDRCHADALLLTKFGINVSGSPPFYLIPSLTIKNGVDFERAELGK